MSNFALTEAQKRAVEKAQSETLIHISIPKTTLKELKMGALVADKATGPFVASLLTSWAEKQMAKRSGS